MDTECFRFTRKYRHEWYSCHSTYSAFFKTIEYCRYYCTPRLWVNSEILFYFILFNIGMLRTPIEIQARNKFNYIANGTEWNWAGWLAFDQIFFSIFI